MANLAQRLALLRSWRNPDGGWGYFPGKQSWLEPTVWAGLALADDRAAAGRTWELVRAWRNPDGGWRPMAAPCDSTWGTALALTLASVLGRDGPEVENGVRWLIETRGAESTLLNRILRAMGSSAVEREVKYAGWPWRRRTSAWLEPTVHALVALKKVGQRRPDALLAARIDAGERMLLSLRCQDGGWNYGSPRALGHDLPSYAETTGLALVGLQDRAPADAVEYARRIPEAQASPLARAWLRLATGGGEVQQDFGSDVLLTALASVDPGVLRS
ncbi:MAG: hypothetical protein JSU00_27830 [Acidobacteria bacterium]|nr:hypothetical protein [Acidobacteriota bacterium]